MHPLETSASAQRIHKESSMWQAPFIPTAKYMPPEAWHITGDPMGSGKELRIERVTGQDPTRILVLPIYALKQISNRSRAPWKKSSRFGVSIIVGHRLGWIT